MIFAMAESNKNIVKQKGRSDRDAQSPVVDTCVLCEGTNANWRCVECCQVICEQCKKIHERQTATKTHHIKYKDAGSNTVCNGSCECHGGQPYSLYCKKCDELVCNKCITDNHSGHAFCQIEEVLEEKREKLKDALEYQRDILSDENTKRERFQKDKRRAFKRYVTIQNAVKDHVSKMRERLDIMESEILKGIEGKRDELNKEIESCEAQQDIRERGLRRMVEEGETILKSGTNIQIVQLECSLAEILTNLPQKVTAMDMPVPSFEPSFQNLSTIKPEEFIGRFTYGKRMKKKPPLERNSSVASIQSQDSVSSGPSIVKYVAQLPLLQDRSVGCVAPISDNEAWVGCPYDQNVYLIRNTGSKVKEFPTEFNISDIALTISGDLLVASAERKCVKLIKGDVIRDFIDTFPSEPHGISVTRKGEILICKTNGDFGQVVRLAENGKAKKEYDVYIVNEQTFLLRKPIRCIETPNGDIWILDEAVKNIIVLDSSGNFRFLWQGPLRGSRKNFDPSGLDCDDEGNVLVTDYGANTIYVISSDGSSTEKLDFEDPRDRERMSDPFGIAVYGNKYLWVGCDDGMLYFLKYKFACQNS